MTRRSFCTLAASFGLTAPALTAQAPKRPNILFAFADDWGRYASIYRDPERPGFNDILSTPALDRIGREGVVFENAFVAAPSCTPSRAAVTSGMYFFRCGRQANLRMQAWDAPNPYDEQPGFPALLQAAGYHVGHAGKTTAKKRGEPEQPSYEAGQTAMSRFSQTASAAADPEAAKREVYEQVRATFRRFLADREDGQPFLYWFGPHNSHRPWVRGSGKKLWGLDPNSLEGRMPRFLPDVPVVREDVADYLGEALAWDGMLGVLLEELERIGELDDTFVAVTGDHGMPGVPYGKCNLYDFGVHVALLARWGAGIPGGRRVTDFANLMDLAPTFLEAAGVAPPAAMQARSLLPVLRSEKGGRVDPARDHVVVGRERHVWHARPGGLPYPSRALRTDDFLYIRNFKPERWPMGDPGRFDPTVDSPGEIPAWEALESDTMVAFRDLDAGPTKAWLVTERENSAAARFYNYAFARRPAEELYDLATDPDQVRNVAADPAYAGTKRRLAERLMGILSAAGDPRLDDAFDRPPYVEPGA